MYYFSYPKLFVYISVGFLIIVAGLGIILIPTFGILGASATMLVAQIFNFAVPAIWVLNKFHKNLEE
jgi:O-antigen/teichoic acid export membrane protein